MFSPCNLMGMSRFADIILPLPLSKYFTYSVPDAFCDMLEIGSRVIVPFGTKKYYTGIVCRLHDTAPSGFETKDIGEVLDPEPILRPAQIKFWEWMAGYYLCAMGDVYKAAVPSGLKLESETKVSVSPGLDECVLEGISDRERRIAEFLKGSGSMTLAALSKGCGVKSIMPAIRPLLEKGIISLSEEIKRKYTPKTEIFLRLNIERRNDAMLRKLFDSLSRAEKQMSLLVGYLELSGFARPGMERDVSRAMLLERTGVSAAVLASMLEKGIFSSYKKEVSRLGELPDSTEEAHALNPLQMKAFEEIKRGFAEKGVVLLHGVTSSGKTEIYIHLIEETLRKGQQALFLVPEIALTAQLANRLARVFGNRLGVYHSKFSDNERVEIWNSLLHDGDVRVVLGVRSSIFLPFKNLGLVIVDEEHDGSYKQQEPAPRYNARNAAIMMAAMFNAKTLLGSATPSVESFYNASTGKYALVRLMSRYADISLPKIEIADIGSLRRKKLMNGEISPTLATEAQKALENRGQVILFRNRRGFAPIVECKECAWVPKCRDCDVSLTYHKRTGQLTCHYCGYSEPMPKRCPSCGSVNLEGIGAGTEHIEEEAAEKFPGYVISRMDLDTTRSRKAYVDIIEDFEKRRSQILIGTQMVTKGLDFGGVRVVGILGADTMLNFPDFRAHERSFQLMEQVAGRAGRQGAQGVVVIQTAQPQHPVIGQVARHDYDAMYAMQIEERRMFGYPPFSRLIDVYLKGGVEMDVERAARIYAARLRSIFGERVLGPDVPPVARIQTMFIRKILLKIETKASVANVREILQRELGLMMETKEFRGISAFYDVDPM